jgi:CubicO group peptidase (beta-lactamase class C family)
MSRRWFVSFALLAALTVSADTPSTGTAVPGMVSYDQLASSLLAKYQIPGAAIAVARNGKLVFARGYGYANTATGELVQPDSRFRIASLAKPITSAAVLLLMERGKLTLDQRVFDILSYEPLPGESVDPRVATITIRHLLEHSGGWNRNTTFDPMFRPVTIAAATGTPAPATPDSIIRYMMGKPLQFDPGSAYNYSNYGYLLLGRIIETISGQPYEKFVREEVLTPSGAACMQLGRSLQAQSLPNEVRYYDSPGAPLWPSIDGTGTAVPGPDGGFYLEAMDAHGGWVASTIDYLRFVLSVDGRNDPVDILAPATVQTMIARPTIPSWSSPAPWYYAKGWQVAPSQGDANWWHLGNLAGTATIVVRSSAGVTWAAFFNSAPGDWNTFANELDNGMWTALAGVKSWPAGDQFQSFAPCATGPRRRGVRH